MRKREADAFARKPVERGRRCRAAVRAERIRAQCVDRDEENILSRTTREIDWPCAPAEEQDRAGNCENERETENRAGRSAKASRYTEASRATVLIFVARGFSRAGFARVNRA